MTLAMQRSAFALVTLLVFLAMGMFSAPAALATPGNGAIHISDFNCHEDDGYTTCFDIEGVANETITPSGNAIYSGHTRGTITLTDPAGNLVYEASTEQQFNRVYKDELLHVLSDHASATITTADGITCTMSYSAHLVDGRIQYEHNQTECN